MEQVIGNVSFWGLITLTITSLQVFKRFLSFKSQGKTRQFQRIIYHQTLFSLRNDYKVWIIFSLSLGILLVFGHYTPTFLISRIFWFNVSWWLFSISLAWYAENNHKHFYFLTNAPINFLAIIGSVILNMFLLLNAYPYSHAQSLLANIATIFLAISFVVGVFRIRKYHHTFQPKPLENNLLSNQRLDGLIISLVSAVLLAPMYSTESVFFILPLLITANYMIIFSLAQQQKYVRLLKVLLAIVLSICTILFVRKFLPETWLRNGVFYQRESLLYSILGALWLSVFSDKIIALYVALQKKYTAYFIDKFFLHKVLTYSLRAFITISLVSLSTWILLYAYQKLELYGIVLVILSVLSNVSAKISFDIPAKWQ
ncbi:MAG: hypothetical protein SFU27_10210 [Thermonemataceae bacterium]|nr:hypothetical protein [Thermonemataceae bacterium]